MVMAARTHGTDIERATRAFDDYLSDPYADADADARADIAEARAYVAAHSRTNLVQEGY